MKKPGALHASAGFWNILRFAAGYYLLLTITEPHAQPVEQLLFLWFGSPALLLAGIHFMEYFRPGQFGGLPALGRMALGLGMAVTAFAIGGSVLYLIQKPGSGAEQGDLLLGLVFLSFCLVVDALFFVLGRRPAPNPEVS